MMILLWLLSLWANSAVLSIVCWALYTTAWVWRHRRSYPTIAACKAVFDRDPINRVLFLWLCLELFPMVLALHWWRCYTAHLAVIHELKEQIVRSRSIERQWTASGTDAERSRVIDTLVKD